MELEWIDTHCHLNLKSEFADPAVYVRQALDVGVCQMVVIGLDIETNAIAVELADRFESIFAVVGYHPTEVAGFEKKWLRPLADYIQHPKVVAVGEIGLDFHWDKTTPVEPVSYTHLTLPTILRV